MRLIYGVRVEKMGWRDEWFHGARGWFYNLMVFKLYLEFAKIFKALAWLVYKVRLIVAAIF